MAIPISMPNAEEVEDSYRSLDLLLEQLIVTLREVLMHRRRANIAQVARHRASTSEPTTTPTDIRQSPTEDLSRVTEDTTNNNTMGNTLPDLVLDTPDCGGRKAAPLVAPPPWVQDTDTKSSRMRDASLLSLLCPPLGGSVWTTVALLVGWGLLSRTR